MFSDLYNDETRREAAVQQLRELVDNWVNQGFNWFDIREGLLQFGGQGDDGIDDEVGQFFSDEEDHQYDGDDEPEIEDQSDDD